MRGIILAAGRGSRMGSLTQKLPKCRTVFNGKELIQWQLGALREAGIKQIAIVRGYLKETFTLDLTYFDNSRWDDTNMVRSGCTWSVFISHRCELYCREWKSWYEYLGRKRIELRLGTAVSARV